MSAENDEKESQKLRRGAITGIVMIGVIGGFFVLDMVMQGLVYRALQSLRSPNNSTLPGEEQTLNADGDRVTLTFLS